MPILGSTGQRAASPVGPGGPASPGGAASPGGVASPGGAASPDGAASPGGGASPDGAVSPDGRAAGSIPAASPASPAASPASPAASPAGPVSNAAGGGRPAASLVGAGILWGSSFLFGKWALASAGPAELTLWRFVIASAVLVGLAGRRAWPRRSDLPLFAVTGVLYVPATFLPQFAGLQRTSASIAALIIGTLPPLVAVAARFLLGERLGRVGWAAVAASTAGVVLIVGHGGRGNSWTGDALVLSSMAAVVGWVLLGKRLLRDYSPLAATAWITTFGTAALIPITLIWQGTPRLDLPWTAWGSIAVLGVGCSAASTALWNWGLRHTPAGRAGLFLNIEPLTGAILGITVLGEPLNANIAIGGALILGSAAAATRRPAPS